MSRRALIAVAGAALLATSGGAGAGTDPVQSSPGCWARLYKSENFAGEALALEGPQDIANIHTGWGFAWDPQFESVAVGPGAVLTVYDNVSFRDRTATFKPGRYIADLDDKMGIFRAIRSLRVRCAK